MTSAPKGTGLIPAHAGKTSLVWAVLLPSAAHPRSRGENIPIVFVFLCVEGSSPLTRGKPVSVHELRQETRLIPAHAGKTSVVGDNWAHMTAHPRSRGENAHLEPAGRDRWGLIPAHAGKTLLSSRSMHRMRAHPRSRGENTAMQSLNGSVPGSSPLTRGKQRTRTVCHFRCRLIPAHAGKTY